MLYRHRAGPRVLDRLAPGAAATVCTRFEIQPIGATIGAEVRGIDLGDPCDAGLFAELDAALHEWKVLFFSDQHLSAGEQARFAAQWGDLIDDQLVTVTHPDPVDNLVVFTRDAHTAGLENEWHTDGTFRVQPTRATVLQALEVPPVGGDTLFADMAAAYDNLEPELKEHVDGLSAIHDWSLGAYAGKYGSRLAEMRAQHPPVEHPVVLAHPDTGRRTLFVNRLFTDRIVGLPPAESDELIDLLCRQAEIPEYQVRMRWRPGAIAFWDNVAVQHYGANDYFPAKRVMARATVMAPGRAARG